MYLNIQSVEADVLSSFTWTVNYFLIILAFTYSIYAKYAPCPFSFILQQSNFKKQTKGVFPFPALNPDKYSSIAKLKLEVTKMVMWMATVSGEDHGASSMAVCSWD